MYRVVYLDSVGEDLKKLDKAIARKILIRIETYLASDPKELGKVAIGRFGNWAIGAGTGLLALPDCQVAKLPNCHGRGGCDGRLFH